MTTRCIAISVLSFALAALSLTIRTTAAEPTRVTSVEGITEYRLDNGLRVLLFPDPTRPKVTVNLTVLVGSRHEGYGETGMAHLLEHMVFKGTPTHPDIPGAMKERGAQFNGSTWLDRTNYYETVNADDDNLEFALKLEADRMVNSPIKAEDLATEFSVVRNEFEAGENSPQSVLSQRMMAVAYEWHNYGKSTIGNRTDIERVPPESLRAFYKRFYQPDNAILVVAGKFDEKKALQYIQKYFGSIPKPDRKLSETYTEEPAQDGERVVTLRRVGDVGLVGLLYHIPSGSHPEYPAVEILGDLLDSEPSGRLYKALVETRKATSVGVMATAGHDPGAIEIMAEVNTKDLAALEKVRDVMISVVEGIGKSGVTQEEVDRARQRILKNRELAASDPNRIGVELSEWAAQGDWRLYFLHRDRIEKVTPEEVKEVAAKYLTLSNRTVGFFVPTAKRERTPVPPAPDVAKLVAGYKGREVKSVATEADDVSPLGIEARLQKPAPIAGVKIAFLPKKTRGESVHLRLDLRYGTATSLKGFTEAADFLGGLMIRGTKSLSRQQIQDQLDKNFVRMSPGGAGLQVLTFTIDTKRANLPAALEILRQVLREPTLPASEFETMKNEELAQIEQARSEPDALASILIRRLITKYPPDDVRYVPTLDESIDRLKKLTIEQVKTLYHDCIGADNGDVVVVGDFEPSEIMPILEKTFDGWKSPKPFVRIDRPFQPEIEAKRETIETPDKENAVLLAAFGFPMNDADPDYPALLVGNSVLGGGGLSSRLADRLRQKGGLSYGAGSFVQAGRLDKKADLFIQAIFNPTNLDKVVKGVDEELAKLIYDGVKGPELEKAKAGYLQQLKIQRTRDASLASALAENLYLGRTMKFQAELEEKIQGLSTGVVDSALRNHIDPKKLTVVTAGDFAKKEPKKDSK
jgi:zinc protease